MREAAAKEYNDSLERCLREEGFLETFYGRFLAASDEIAALFAHVDMGRQRLLLKASLFMCAAAGTDYGAGKAFLREMGRRHRNYGVEPDHYEIWLSTLVSVVGECDPHFTEKTAAAWETVLRRGIELLKEGHFENAA